MKNIFKLFGIITIVVMIGFTIVGCPAGSQDENQEDEDDLFNEDDFRNGDDPVDEDDPVNEDDSADEDDPVDEGDPIREGFWAVDYNNVTYHLIAELLAKNDYSEIWVEVGSGITRAQARAFANEYAAMRGKLLNAFSRKNFATSGRQFANILNFANWLTRGDGGGGRLTVLLLDIRAPPGLIIGGYFHPRDFFDVPHSNRRDMVYINSSFLAASWNDGLGVLAHEVVHLINWSETELAWQNYAQWGVMDLWINEGLAEKSYYVVFGRNPVRRVNWFVSDPAGTISRGNNFFVWGNHRNIDPRAILDDYATAYLFVRWLFLQARAAPGVDHTRLLCDMVTSPYSDHRIVTSAARGINPAWANWDVLLKTWLAANFDPTNPVFGYTGDNELRSRLAGRLLGNTSLSLYPGEGVFSVMNVSFTPPPFGSGPNIRYAGLTPGSGDISFGTSSITGNALLTFNANININGQTETGFLTGVSPPAAMLVDPLLLPTGPFIVSLWDIAGRDSEGGRR